jgi:hypothetical protein
MDETDTSEPARDDDESACCGVDDDDMDESSENSVCDLLFSAWAPFSL